ncbi:MAG TPA: hypothetical protein ENK52_04210 [Saprospiraceae bacterium]|nr:hypothetical protein [Saprospiraceae bacterium]
MIRLVIPTFLIFSFSLLIINACQKTASQLIEDFSTELQNQSIDISAPNISSTKLKLSKPAGKEMALILLLQEKKDINSTSKARFLERGYMLAELSFDANTSIDKRQEQILASLHYLKHEFIRNNVSPKKIIVKGESDLGINALMAGMEKMVDGVVVDAPKFTDSKKNSTELLKAIQSPFLIITGENDPNISYDNILAIEAAYHNCQNCTRQGEFIYYPGGVEGYHQEMIWEVIFSFIEAEV